MDNTVILVINAYPNIYVKNHVLSYECDLSVEINLLPADTHSVYTTDWLQ